MLLPFVNFVLIKISNYFKISDKEIVTLIEIPGDLGDITETENSDDKCYFVTESDFLNYSDTDDDDVHNAPPAEINMNVNYNMNIKINH